MFKSNIDGLVETWKQDWKAEALAEGKAEGLALGKAEGKAEGLAERLVEGKTEGKAEALLCILAERFGTVKPSLLQSIREANLATVERWIKRAISAPNLPLVFGSDRIDD